MAKEAEAKLIEFLTSEDNARFVVDILRFGKPIRTALLTRFWDSLANHLQESKGQLCSSSMPLQWLLPTNEEKTSASSSLYYWDERLKEEEQHLDYSVCMESGKNYCWIGVGLTWQDLIAKLPNKSRLYKLEAVAELKNRLLAWDFREVGSFLGYREIKLEEPFATMDDFLGKFLEQREALLSRISEEFWPLVKETQDLVAKANEQIVAASPKRCPTRQR